MGTTSYLVLTETQARDFWAQIAKQTDGCAQWRGSFDMRDRPVFYVQSAAIPAYRIAWVLQHDHQLPSNHVVRRTCKNSACVAPGHLKRIRQAAPKSLKSKVRILRPPGTEARALKGRWTKAREKRELKEIKESVSANSSALRQLSGIIHTNSIIHAELDAKLSLILELSQDTSKDLATQRALEQMRAAILDVQLTLTRIPEPETDVVADAVIASVAAPPLEPAPVLVEETDPTEPLAPETEEPPTEPAGPDSEPTTEPEAEPEPPEEKEATPKQLGALLASVLAETMTVEPTDHLILEAIYADAQAEAQTRGNITPIELLNRWLDDFQESVAADPDKPSSVAEFRRAVDALILPPAANV